MRSEGDGNAVGRLTTAAGIKALGACCSGLARLLRLATRRASAADPEAVRALQIPAERVERQSRPVTCHFAAMDTLYDSCAVLCYWAPRPGRQLGACLGTMPLHARASHHAPCQVAKPSALAPSCSMLCRRHAARGLGGAPGAGAAHLWAGLRAR